MLSTTGIQKTSIGPFGSLEIDVGKNIAFLSGDVPRLVIREGSDAWDLLEGQSLLVRGPKAQVINPFGRVAEVQLGFGMQSQIIPPSAIATSRHYDKTRSTAMPYYALNQAAPTDRSWYHVFAPKKSTYEIEIVPRDQPSTRYQIFKNVPPNFIALRPAGVNQAGGILVDCNSDVVTDLEYFCGDINVGTELYPWLTSAGVSDTINWQLTDSTIDFAQRWIVSPGKAAMFCREPAASFNVRFVVQDRGVPSSAFQ